MCSAAAYSDDCAGEKPHGDDTRVTCDEASMVSGGVRGGQGERYDGDTGEGEGQESAGDVDEALGSQSPTIKNVDVSRRRDGMDCGRTISVHVLNCVRGACLSRTTR